MARQTPPYKIAPERAHYSIVLASGAVTGISAADPIFSMRWTSSELVCLVSRFNMFWTITTAFGAAQNVAYGLYFARGYTVVDSGGTATTLTDVNKLDTRYPTSQVADMRIATTGTLTAGTRTLDTYPLAAKSGGSNTLGLGTDDSSPRTFGDFQARQPIVLRANEGLVLANLVNYGATGVTTVYVEIEWAEVASNLI